MREVSDNWLEILRGEVAKNGQNQTAGKLGYSKTTISQVMNNRYSGNISNIARRVNQVLTTVTCPYTGATVTQSQCAEACRSPAPTHHPLKLRHWQACQRCEFNDANHSGEHCHGNTDL